MIGTRCTLSLLTIVALSTAAQAADPAAGKSVFTRCAACHSASPGVTLMGPSLAGVVGRKAGSLPGFHYSPAMMKSGRVWSTVNLDAFLSSPQQAVPGTKMPFGGMRDAKERADLIAYLGTLTNK